MDEPQVIPYLKPGRKPSCECGGCVKCKKAAYMRRWWNSKTLDERRAMTARRTPRPKPYTPEVVASIGRSRARYPEKVAARRAIQREVNAGRVARLACFCGDPKSEAHHPDYSKPLDVMWLCRKHHGEMHRKVA